MAESGAVQGWVTWPKHKRIFMSWLRGLLQCLVSSWWFGESCDGRFTWCRASHMESVPRNESRDVEWDSGLGETPPTCSFDKMSHGPHRRDISKKTKGKCLLRQKDLEYNPSDFRGLFPSIYGTPWRFGDNGDKSLVRLCWHLTRGRNETFPKKLLSRGYDGVKVSEID